MPPLVCHTCGAAVTLDEPIPRDAECESCGRDLRCCLNCRHYDTRYNNSCRETMADPVEEKHRRNFCEYFSFSREPFAATKAPSSREAEARAKLSQLFGGSGSAKSEPPKPAHDKLAGLSGSSKPPDPRAADAKKKLDALFGKPKPAADDTAESDNE
jgi:hypothetical protein